ncbi:hypothetical protein BPTFM16_02864 [Altererythrobacter insulae]|nr:hypothetical protein BPTFM16_02864 [Altererythrobacter insulae]
MAKEKQVNITFFINPYHFSYLHTLYDNNQWSNFQVWKKTLVNYLSIMQGEEFILWDFSGESDFVNEVVPLANPKQQMQWFWEPAHYKKELGDLLLERLFTEQDEEYFGFGVRLTTENIADTLEKDQASLQSHFALWQRLQKEL